MQYIWALLGENVSLDMGGQRRPWSDCASAQSDQGLRCPQTESLATKECMHEDHRSEWHFAHAQDDVNPHFLRMLEGTFSHDTVHMQYI